jgi:hypothetical protein
MHFFSPERAESSPGTKTILIENSALPVFTVYPIGKTTIRLRLFLRNYKENGRSYSEHHIDLLSTEMSAFFTSYIEDPEGTLERYCGWKPQAATRLWSPSDFAKAPRAVKPVASTEDQALMDLL